MHPQIFGPHTFAIFLTLTIAIGTLVHVHLVRRAGLLIARILTLYAALGAAMLVGARAFSILFDADPSSSRWLVGRMRYPGALLAAGIALPLLGPWLGRGVPLRLWGDLLVPSAGFALATLRIDCFLAGCCAGHPTQLPWAVRFPAGSNPWYTQVLAGLIPTSAPHALPAHPLQIYFLLLALAVGALALWWLPRKSYDGQVLLLFLAVHELGKSALEFLRDPPLPQLQIVSLVIGLAASAALVAIHLRSRSPARLEAT